MSEPGGAHEREADRAAERVMRTAGSRHAVAEDAGVSASRRGGSGGGTVVGGEAELLIDSLTGGGRPLSPSARSFFEPRFGRDFGDVRVHTGPEADEAARSIDSEAFTLGRDVGFRTGRYDPNGRRGRRLLAHELAHVGQNQDAVGEAPSAAPRGSADRSIVKRQTSGRQVGTGGGNEAERAAERLQSIAESADSREEMKRDVAAYSEDHVEPLGADAVVVSLSGMGGYYAGGGGGLELVYHFEHGWHTFLQMGLGFASPGGSVALEVGLIWGLEDPRNYAGPFIEAGGAYAVGWVGGGLSGAVTPDASTGGVKGGYAAGTPGFGVLFEWYFHLSGTVNEEPDRETPPREEEPRGSVMDVIGLAQIAGSAALTSPWRPSEWSLRGDWQTKEELPMRAFGRLMRTIAIEEIRTLESMGVENPFETFWIEEDTGGTTVRDRLGSEYDFLLRDVVDAVNSVANRRWGGDVLDLELFDERSYLQIMRLLEDAELLTTYGETEQPLRKTVSE